LRINFTLNQRLPWEGKLELIFTKERDQTQLSHNYSLAPFKVQRPFYPEGSQICHTVIIHTAGGVTGGDRLLGNLQLHPQTHALITTAAAAKIYRSSGEIAQQIIKIKLEESSCLEWFPQETIIFNQAIYQQELHVDLALGSIWIGWDILRFGRTARGEQFLEGNFASAIEIWQQGIPLWIERQYLTGGEMLKSLQGLAGDSVIGTFTLVGKIIDLEMITQLRCLWTLPATSGKIGVTRLSLGVICRYQGHSVQDCRRWFMAVWHLLRLFYLGCSAHYPRVWMI
jgi:urease accessory protein